MTAVRVGSRAPVGHLRARPDLQTCTTAEPSPAVLGFSSCIARSMSGARPLAELDSDEAGRRELSALLVRFRCMRLPRLDCVV